MNSFKYGDKADHPLHGRGTVLNAFPGVSLLQFWPDKARPNGPTVDVHPVALTKVLSDKDVHPGMFYVKNDGGDCEMLEASDLAEALDEFAERLKTENHYLSLWFRIDHGDWPPEDAQFYEQLAVFNGDVGIQYLVTKVRLDEWLAILPGLR